MSNSIFIAMSLDGYIADKNGSIAWLNEIPNPDNIDCGFAEFMSKIDAVIMGRKTFEMVVSFDCVWPYSKPVFVLSNTLQSIPEKFAEKVKLLKGPPVEIVNILHKKGLTNLYIDGGTTVQNFIKENLLDELVITIIPILLGGGARLFGDLLHPIKFDYRNTKIFLNSLVQIHYTKKG